MFYSPAFTFSSIYPLGFCRVPGFALGCCASFRLFWPLALVQQALPAIILQALRRLRGAVLFRSLRPSSSWGFPCWLLGLTVQSSRPAFGGRLIWAVSPITRSMRAATCSSAPPCSKGFLAFWASSACQPSTTSYHACSSAPLSWRSAFSWAEHVFKAGRSLLAFGSNCSSQPTAYGGG